MKRTFFNFIIIFLLSISFSYAEIDNDTLNFWIKTLKYGTISQKTKILTTIRVKKVKEIENKLLEFLKTEKDRDVKKQLIYTLAALSNSKVLKYLDDFLNKDSDSEDIYFGFNVISLLGKPEGFKLIKPFLSSDNKEIRARALRVAGETGSKEALIELKKRFKEEKDPELRKSIILAFTEMKTPEVEKELLSVYTNTTEPEINRAYAVTGLGYSKDKKVLELFLKRYDEESEMIKIRIVEAVGNLGYKEGAPLLLHALESDNKSIRYFAIKSIEKLKIKEAIEYLEYKKDYDFDCKVREAARQALKKIKGKESDS